MSIPVISLELLKSFLGEASESDEVLQIYLDAALEYLEHRTGAACKNAWIDSGRLPAAAILFLVQFVQIYSSMEAGGLPGPITQEKIGGLSQSFGVGSTAGSIKDIGDLWLDLLGGTCEDMFQQQNFAFYTAVQRWE